MLRSVGAVTAGFVVIFVLATGIDLGLRAALPSMYGPAGRVDDAGLLVLTLAYVFTVATFGCWLTARLAPSHPRRHAMVLGVLGLAFNGAGTMAMWDTAPAWYHVAALLLVLPAAWLGGMIRERQTARAPRPLAAA